MWEQLTYIRPQNELTQTVITGGWTVAKSITQPI